MRPVIVVHGILDSARRIEPLTAGLRALGVGPISAVDLVPRWGFPQLERHAEQLAAFVDSTLRTHGARELDLVGFSMGALIARLYLRELARDVRVHNFVSISGPHRGTHVARAFPFAGVRQMRPDSALLRRLGDDCSALAPTRVHCIYTPYDAMILPPSSSVLPGAASVHRIPVPLHRLMLSDRRVLTTVAGLLKQSL